MTGSGRLTDRRRLLLRSETIVRDVNAFLRGWAGYFRYGQLGPTSRQDQELCADAAGAVRQQAASSASTEFGWWVMIVRLDRSTLA